MRKYGNQLVGSDTKTIVFFSMFSFLLVIWTLMCQLLAKWLNWLSNIRNDNQVQQFQNNISELLEEENQVILDGLCSVKTWTFLLPSKKHWINIPIHALCAVHVIFEVF